MTDRGALAGVRVVEFAQNAAIPHCGRLLAGMGADVVKVEPPGGDAMRGLAGLGPMEARGFALINPNKRAMALDLQQPAAAAVVEGLFAWADIALVALKQQDQERYGLEWERARAVNPRLVYLSSNALGPHGPESHVGGYDVLEGSKRHRVRDEPLGGRSPPPDPAGRQRLRNGHGVGARGGRGAPTP